MYLYIQLNSKRTPGGVGESIRHLLESAGFELESLEATDGPPHASKEAYENSARMDKAIAIHALMLKRKISVERASKLTEIEWQSFASQAGVRRPSDTTKLMIVDMLRKGEGLR